MEVKQNDPPRRFRVGVANDIEMTDCGRVHLDENEQVTFVTESGKQHDFAAKSWGFYATPSINGRLKTQGFRTALVRNWARRYYVMVVEAEMLDDFRDYLMREGNEVVEWLDERE